MSQDSLVDLQDTPQEGSSDLQLLPSCHVQVPYHGERKKQQNEIPDCVGDGGSLVHLKPVNTVLRPSPNPEGLDWSAQNDLRNYYAEPPCNQETN